VVDPGFSKVDYDCFLGTTQAAMILTRMVVEINGGLHK
jgi:hypothetical protein